MRRHAGGCAIVTTCSRPCSRCAPLTAEWPPSAALLEQPGVDLLIADMRLLKTLVANMGLNSAWLPKMLWFDFARAAASPHDALEVSLPAELVWPDAGRAPKHGEVHHEDLERNLTWLYRRTVKTPPDFFSALEKEHIESKARMGVRISKARNTVKNGIRRAQQLLRCINHG